MRGNIQVQQNLSLNTTSVPLMDFNLYTYTKPQMHFISTPKNWNSSFRPRLQPKTKQKNWAAIGYPKKKLEACLPDCGRPPVEADGDTPKDGWARLEGRAENLED